MSAVKFNKAFEKKCFLSLSLIATTLFHSFYFTLECKAFQEFFSLYHHMLNIFIFSHTLQRYLVLLLCSSSTSTRKLEPRALLLIGDKFWILKY
ncbi:hypothetical protein VNO80_19950 [Phaseolus coccineus]|uniref:Uncharacterized protein n=1 Tax=Phaseolus coccineus TaxID=3886 RepID=A0AAN9R0R4_PHACN